jgi:hypothetical protein
MRNARSPSYENLEARMLFNAKVHHAVVPKAPAVVVPLVLDGTLAVDQKAASVSQDSVGDMTTSVPVVGQLAGLGKVHGVWNESQDSMGTYLGPDTIQLRDSQGAFVIMFNDASPGKPHRNAAGAVYNPLSQRVIGGAGAYAKATEAGTIVMSTNAARTNVQSLTLNTSST